jgi:glycosyltransferase involved in cell wall biosynthesis
VSEAPPRIIFLNRVYRPSPAATAQLLTDLAEGLAARGWPVQVIAAGAESGDHHGVTVHRTGEGDRHGGLVSRTLNYWRFIRRARRLLATLAQPGDIVVPMTDPPMLGAAVTATARHRGAHVIHWIQDIYPEIVTAHIGALAGAPLLPLRLRRDAAWRSARCCVTLGEDMAQAVAGRGVPADHIAIVPNWAPRELQAGAEASAVTARRAAWGLADKFVVAYSGNLGRVHEFAAVVDAAERLRDRPAIVFLFVGTGARFDEVRSAARSRGLANVRFLPPEPREQLAAALAAADVQLVTLKAEFAHLVYPSKLAGVLAAGRPVLFVGPPEGEIARLLEREQCGVTVAPTDGARLAGTVSRWLADPEQRARLGRRARAAYEKQFAFEPALLRWTRLLREAGAAGEVRLHRADART